MRHHRKQVEDFLVNHQIRQHSSLQWEAFAFSGSSVEQIDIPFSYVGKQSLCFSVLPSEVPQNLDQTTHLTNLWWFKKKKNKIKALNIKEATVLNKKKTVFKLHLHLESKQAAPIHLVNNTEQQIPYKKEKNYCL